jgi:dipeptidyl aminopeptidase/acylaminoacyl peptidase
MQFNLSVPKKTVQGLVIALMVLASSGDALKAQDRSENEHATMTISSWLKAGSFDVKMPAFSDQKSVKGDTFGESDLLKFSFAEVDALDPQEKNELTWKGNKLAWEKVVAAKNSFVYPDSKPQKDSHQMAYVAAYLQADRWMEAELEVTSPQLLEIYINGVLHDSKAAADKPEVDQTGSTKKTLKLERGKHLLLIKTLKPAGDENDWMVKATLSFPKKFEKSLQASLTPGTIKNIHQLLEGEFVNSSSVSPDGQMALLRFSNVAPPEGKTERWAEIRNLVDGGVIHTFRHADISSVSWVPEGRALSYRTSKDGKSTLWLFDLNDMSLKQLLSDAEDLGSYRWAPDGAFLIYSISEKADKDKSGMKRLEGMPDRWPWWRSRSFLYRLDVQSGVSERLTYGHLSSDLHDIHPDGNKILFSQNLPDFTARPYSKQVLMEMDLETFKVDTIWENNVSGSCQYSPNGQYLLVTASATMFGNVGVNISDDAVPNESDTQAYIYSLGAGDVDPVTFAFNPSVIMAEWSQYDENKIYFVTTDRTFRNIYVYDMNTRYFDKIETGLDVVDGFSLARYQPVALCTGSGVSSPPDVRKVDLATGDIEVIANPREEQFRHVAFGKTEEWNFTSDAGVEIEGRIYYPPDFDESKKYPLIVYYYAGTSPTDRSFGGRYPKNMFAAQGFVVYNLQPSGATGYGQDFSAAHVNNWGITVADEIIQGTERFVEDHSFVDAEKIGCIGASYGGFMTMLLLSRTDIFAAGISHAGISNIASYWGEGYWGYLYSASASANSFPWNNPELYIGQSALYSADKIHTPLLLLHGADDTNVPPGESLQLYTALKLLGRPVELIEVEGQDHHILDYKKRIAWQKTIFAWFDKWLKDQPEWWQEMYPVRDL